MQNPTPQFSVYNLFVEQGQSLDIFSEQRRMLALWCANIERTIIQQELKTAHVFASFQQLDFFLPVLDRYRQMTAFVDNIWIFGIPSLNRDFPQLDGINYIYLEEADVLTQEWFLVVNHPRYSRSLSALETTSSGTPHKDRTYKGILSSVPGVITPVFDKLMSEFVKVTK